MAHVQDDKYAKLIAVLGGGAYTGPTTINDMELAWLKSQAGVTALDIEGAWHNYWDQLVIPAGAFNDRASAWLTGLGHTGSLDDQWASYWATP